MTDRNVVDALVAMNKRLDGLTYYPLITSSTIGMLVIVFAYLNKIASIPLWVVIGAIIFEAVIQLWSWHKRRAMRREVQQAIQNLTDQ